MRDPNKARDLADRGVALVQGSFEDPASLDRAFAEVDTVVLVTPPGARADVQAHAALDAIARRRVRKVVRLSGLRSDVDGPTENTRQHGAIDRRIRDTVGEWVVVRPHFFLQNFLGDAASILAGELVHGVGGGRLGMVDTRDVVDVLAAVATSDRWNGWVIDPTGPASVSMDEVAAALAEGLGRPVRYVDVGPEGMGDRLRAFGADPYFARLLTEYSRAYRVGFGDFVTDHVEQVTGRPPRGLADFVREVFVPTVSPRR